MNEDYLWDKSGQPDPEIQQLEEILGTLRYQPRPLEIPTDLSVPRRRYRYFPVLAIAATVLLALLAAGIWLKVRRVAESQPRQANIQVTPPLEDKTAPKENVTPVEKASLPKSTVATNNRRRNKSSSTVLAKREREEALAAKEQLMLALRLASEKLNLAHRRTQSTTPANQIKNQHRVG
jgi:hypothetical protein